MAILRGIEAGAILWKSTEQVERMDWSQNTGAYRTVFRTQYNYYTLTTRRARTLGTWIDKSLLPFFEQLNIRLYPVSYAAYRNNTYVAVGVQKHVIGENSRAKEIYDQMEIDELAAKKYASMSNQLLSSILEKSTGTVSGQSIEEFMMLSEIEEEEVESWPSEPHFNVEYGYELA